MVYIDTSVYNKIEAPRVRLPNAGFKLLSAILFGVECIYHFYY